MRGDASIATAGRERRGGLQCAIWRGKDLEKDASADGLRGLAALNVVLSHYMLAIFPLGMDSLWPGIGDQSRHLGGVEHVMRLPGISLLWNGTFPVFVFFALSGYVLSEKFSKFGDLSDLSTKALRRFFRLGIPVFGSVMLAYILMSTGITAWKQAAQISGSNWLSGFWNFEPKLWDALLDGSYRAILAPSVDFNPPLWTMYVEFVGSLMVFGYVAIVPRGRMAVPFFATVLVAIISLNREAWPCYMAFLAGVHIGRMTSNPPRWAMVLAAIVGLYLGGFDSSALYTWADTISGDFFYRKYIFNSLGGICIVYAVRGGLGSTFLSRGVVQYLGRISYSIYLVHIPLMLTLLSSIYVWLITTEGWGRYPASLVSILLTLCSTCVVASGFQRTFDTWGISLSRKLFPGNVKAAIS